VVRDANAVRNVIVTCKNLLGGTRHGSDRVRDFFGACYNLPPVQPLKNGNDVLELVGFFCRKKKKDAFNGALRRGIDTATPWPGARADPMIRKCSVCWTNRRAAWIPAARALIELMGFAGKETNGPVKTIIFRPLHLEASCDLCNRRRHTKKAADLQRPALQGVRDQMYTGWLIRVKSGLRTDRAVDGIAPAPARVATSRWWKGGMKLTMTKPRRRS